MPYLIQTISENLCIGDSLQFINSNYVNLDNGIATLSAQNASLKTSYNTLVRTLTGFAATDTTYNSLSTTFRNLSSLIIP